MSSDTKQLLEDCTYLNGCVPGAACEGCAVEVIIMMMLMMLTIMMMVMLMIMIMKLDHDREKIMIDRSKDLCACNTVKPS